MRQSARLVLTAVATVLVVRQAAAQQPGPASGLQRLLDAELARFPARRACG